MTDYIRAVLILAVALFGCSGKKADNRDEETNERSGFQDVEEVDAKAESSKRVFPDGVEMIGDVALVRVDVGRFDKLPAKAKKQIYHLYRAALLGDAVYYRQLGPDNLKIKKMLEAIASVGKQVNHAIEKRIAHYLKLFWINHGTVDAWNGRRIPPLFIPGELAAAAKKAMDSGADLGTADIEGAKLGANRIEELEALLAAVRPWIFDTRVFAEQVEGGLAPDSGPDIGKGSVKQMEAEMELLAKRLKEIQKDIEPDARSVLRHLAQVVAKGEPSDSDDGIEVWEDAESGVKAAMGFFEGSPNFRKQGGDFGAIVAVENRDMTTRMARVAEKVVEYARLMPYDSRFKVLPKDLVVPEVSAVEVVAATGYAGPVSSPVVSISIDRGGKRANGRKILYLANVIEAFDRVFATDRSVSFPLDRDVVTRWERCAKEARFAYSVMREVMGKGDWTPQRETREDKEGSLGELSTVLEEMRADLAALYLAADPLTRQIGLLAEEECAFAIYDGYAGSLEALVLKAGMPGGEKGARMRATRAVTGFALDRGMLEVADEDGRSYIRVKDYERLRSAFGEMLGRVQRTLVLKDRDEAETLVAFGSASRVERWSKVVRASRYATGIPRAVAFFYPLLNAKLDNNNQIADVELEYPDSFMERQLGLASKGVGTGNVFKAPIN